MKQNIKSIAGNFHYLFCELYLFRKNSVFLPFLGSTLRTASSLITIWIPKIVLDLIESNADTCRLLSGILAGCAALLTVSTANALVHNHIDCCSRVFLFTGLKSKWEEKMMDLDYEIFSSPSGKRSAEKARNAVSSPNFGVVTYLRRVTELLESIGGIFALSAVICMLHPLILLLLLLLFGIELWYAGLTERRRHRLQADRAGANRKLNYVAYHTRGISEGKDIRVYAMTAWLRRTAQEAVASKDHVEESIAHQDFKKMILNGALVFLRNGCAYAYLIWQYFHGSMTVGDFALAFSAVTGLGGFLGRLAQGCSGFMEADNYVTDFRQFMDLGSKKRKQKHSADTVTGDVSFVWENVSFSYHEKDETGSQKEIPVLKDISLTIRPGEKLAIVGANGAGKTTFVKLLCGLLRPTEGRILVNGMDIADFDGEDYRELFSAVFQKSGVLPVSIRENIMLNVGDVRENDGREALSEKKLPESDGRVALSGKVLPESGGKEALSGKALSEFGRKEALSGKALSEPDNEDVWRCIRLAGLEEKVRSLPEGADTPLVRQITEHGTELSGGERQRLLLARALYKDAPVLILDEPTAALDPIAENQIYQAYGRLTKGRTSVFISHRLASTRFCDRILVMEDGKITESGTHTELMAKEGSYAEMFRVQSRYYAMSPAPFSGE